MKLLLGPLLATLCGLLAGCGVLLVGAMVALVIAEAEVMKHERLHQPGGGV